MSQNTSIPVGDNSGPALHYKILDIGCGKKPYKDLFAGEEYIGIDIQGGGHTDSEKTVNAYYDGTKIPFKDQTFDITICTQVLEHADDANALIAECSRVMKPDAKLFLTMPFVYPEHEIPFDFRRFTKFGHEKICKENGLNIVEIQKTTGLFGTFAQLLSLGIFEGIPFKASVLKTLLTIIILMPIQLLGIILDIIFRKAGPTMDYVVVAKKRKQ